MKYVEITFSKSRNWKNWVSEDDKIRCEQCEELQGKVYTITEKPDPSPPLHPHCRCRIEVMKALRAGTATNLGIKGADCYLKYYNKLPENYITKERAKEFGWKSKSKNLSDIAPGYMVTGIYKNLNGHLPTKVGRTWQEADINYKNGKRNNERILFSSDGLFFVTYDHYKTFIEIR